MTPSAARSLFLNKFGVSSFTAASCESSRSWLYRRIFNFFFETTLLFKANPINRLTNNNNNNNHPHANSVPGVPVVDGSAHMQRVLASLLRRL